jgi:hypothetical protein
MNSSLYVKELELLILETLLPVYKEYKVSTGSNNPYEGINIDVLNKIKNKKELPALLKAKT